MTIMNDMIVEITLSPAINRLGFLTYALLKESGCTEDEIKFIDKTGGKCLWCILLDYYLKGSIFINDFVASVLRRAIPCIKNIMIEYELNTFLNMPNKQKAVELYNKIKDDMPKDIYEEGIKNLTTILNKIYKYTSEQNIETYKNSNLITQNQSCKLHN